jgi:hypothetical protein
VIAALRPSGTALTPRRVAELAVLAFLTVLPVVVVGLVFFDSIRGDSVAFDFKPFFRAAESILDGESPYPSDTDPLTADAGPYVYPPLPALTVLPLTVLPDLAAGLLVMVALVLAALAIPYVLGIRDWRLYALTLLWPPVISAIQTGNITLILALAAALTWRSRDRRWVSGASIGVTLAAKFFLWPVVVWLAAARRLAAALAASLLGAGLLVASWAAIGFAGLRDYPGLLERLEETVGADSYTLYIAALDAGAAPGVARAIWLGVGLAILAAAVLLARSGREQNAFVLAIAASLSLTPIVWLHYFAFLLVVVAIAQPRMGPAWFVPFAMVLTPGSGAPTPFETSWTLGAAGLTFGLALWAGRRAGETRPGVVASDDAVAPPVASPPGEAVAR